MTNLHTLTETPKIFLTDYASYNNGSQFEFGHWLELDQFNDVEELNEYIQNHFKEADEKRPLPCGSVREEIMITDFEGFPGQLYSESMNFETLFKLFDYCKENNLESLENEGENLLSLWNEYCLENNSDDLIFCFDDDTLQMMFGNDLLKVFTAGCNAKINWSDDYLRFDGYANINSLNDPSAHIDETLIIDWILETQI